MNTWTVFEFVKYFTFVFLAGYAGFTYGRWWEVQKIKEKSKELFNEYLEEIKEKLREEGLE